MGDTTEMNSVALFTLFALFAFAVAAPADEWTEQDIATADTDSVGYGKPKAASPQAAIAKSCTFQAALAHARAMKKKTGRRLLGKEAAKTPEAKEKATKAAAKIKAAEGKAKVAIKKDAACCTAALACRAAAKAKICATVAKRRLLGRGAAAKKVTPETCAEYLKGRSIAAATAMAKKAGSAAADVVKKLEEMHAEVVTCLKAKSPDCDTTQAWSAPTIA